MFMKIFARTNQLKAGVILSYLSMAVNYVIGIVYTPIMLRLLGQSEYGLYNLVSSVVSYLSLFTFGLDSAYVRFYSRYKVEDNEHDIAKLNGMFLIVFSILGIVALVAGVFLVANTRTILGENLTSSEQHTANILMTILGANLVLQVSAGVPRYTTANERYAFQNTCSNYLPSLGTLSSVFMPRVHMMVAYLTRNGLGTNG